MRLEKAMKGWGADAKVLIRILGGWTTPPTADAAGGRAQRAHTRTLKDALRANIKGNS